MNIRSLGFAAFAASLITTSAFAQDVEPNQSKAEADVNGVIQLTAGQPAWVNNATPAGSISGTTTGAVTTVGSTLGTTVDTYHLKTTGYAPGSLYEHRLTLTSPVVGHTGTLRGLNQTGTIGVGGTAGTVDSVIQTTITTSVPPRMNLWYGFGLNEEIYYRVAGTVTTTAAYTATLTTNVVVPTAIAPVFDSNGPITITTIGQTTADTELMLHDGAGVAVPTGVNDDTPGSTQSRLRRILAPGTYYLAVATFELCSNITAPADDNFVGGLLTDFPNVVVLSNSSLLTADWDFQIIGCNGIHTQTNTRPANTPFAPTWFTFTCAPAAAPFGPPFPAPANDTCGAAANVLTGNSVVGTFKGATNSPAEAVGSADATGNDVWFSFTNAFSTGSILSLNTCTTSIVSDTMLGVYNACGGTVIVENDDCGGAPCGGTNSCLQVALAPGQVVKIRVSDKGLSGCDFSLSVSNVVPPPVNNECATPISINGLGNFALNTLGATTGTQGQTEPLCLASASTAINQDVWYEWLASNSGLVSVSVCGLIAAGPTQDSRIAVYDGFGCPTAAAIACNDDFTCTGFSGLNSTVTFTAVCGNLYTFQIGSFAIGAGNTLAGQFSVTSVGPSCNTPTTVFCLGDGTGAPCPCGNTGAAGHGCGSLPFPGGALLVATGTASDETVSGPLADTLRLTAFDVRGPAMFIQSDGQFVSNPFGDGHRCASIGIIRLGVVFPTGFRASYPGGDTANEIHIQGFANAGDTKNYQCWYRTNPSLCGFGNYNLTQGLSLTWGN